MNKEKQRIAIAELCGWKRYEPTPESVSLGYPRWGHWVNPTFTFRDALPIIPDYLNDLNAMAEAERHPEIQNNDDAYMKYLAAAVSGKRCYKLSEVNPSDLCHATASQRAEAFLRTMGKWQE